LKRGAPPAPQQKKVNIPTLPPAKGSVRKPAASAPVGISSIQFIPAISDANGPDPRPYTDNLKPDEEEKLRKKILALAADEVRARAAQLATASAGSQPERASSKSATRVRLLPQPRFEDAQFSVFDLFNSNEPELVLIAKASMPGSPNSGAFVPQFLVTVVAREDIYGDLHKAFANVTDTLHLDVLPRMELIDAVDADGDGRGELLFRQISDAGKAFVLYRVIGDRLWPLFQGTPGP
jgi:hypothetical protein